MNITKSGPDDDEEEEGGEGVAVVEIIKWFEGTECFVRLLLLLLWRRVCDDQRTRHGIQPR